jgi:ketosteroid isomerase-like protein
VLGDWAWLRNYLTVTVTPPGGEPMRRAGYALTILRKQNGKWLLARDANLPAKVEA